MSFNDVPFILLFIHFDHFSSSSFSFLYSQFSKFVFRSTQTKKGTKRNETKRNETILQ